MRQTARKPASVGEILKEEFLPGFGLARVFGTSADFWLNIQRQNDLWEALNSPHERERIERARPIEPSAS